MFKVVTDRKFRWPVTVLVPSDDTPGTFTEAKFTGIFTAPRQDDFIGYLEELSRLSPAEAQRRETEVLKDRLVGWGDDVVDETGMPLSFSAATRDRAMQEPWFRTGVMRAYLEASNGQAARVGN